MLVSFVLKIRKLLATSEAEFNSLVGMGMEVEGVSLASEEVGFGPG